MRTARLVTDALVGSPDPGLLDEAARLATLRRAAVRTRDVATPQPAPDQDPSQPPSAFADAVGSLVGTTTTSTTAATRRSVHDALVVEALRLLADAGLVLPTALLGPLLRAARTSSEVRAVLPPVLGARGRWLTGLDPSWWHGPAAAGPRARDWEEGTVTERVAWVRHVRATDPGAGRELVASARGERAADRARLVLALETGLCPADEELLEGLLRDRSRKVGAAAARLLSRLDGSAYTDRLVALARACLTPGDSCAPGGLGGQGSHPPVLAVAPSEQECQASFLSEVAEPLPSAGPSGRLAALVSVVPPHRWAEAGVSLTSLGGTVLLDDEPTDLTRPLAQAATRWRDADAARCLLPRYRDISLALVLPHPERDAAVEEVVRAASVAALPGLVGQLHAAPGLRLGQGAAEALLDRVTTSLRSTGAAVQSQAMTEQAYQVLAVAAAPESLETVLSRLAEISYQTGPSRLPDYAQCQVRDALDVVALRHSIHQSLKEPQ